MKLFFGFLSVIGFFFTIGSAGAIECNNIGLLQGVLQMLAGMIVMFASYVAAERCCEHWEDEE